MIKTIVLFALLLSLLSSCMKTQECDLVIHNAEIYTLNAKGDYFEAMAIKDGKILELGPERQILNKYRYTEAYDAKNRFVYPGFIDAHCHFLGYGLSLQQVDLKGCASFNEVLNRLQAYDQQKTSEWITGRGWDHTKWKGNRFPNNKAIDSLFPHTPVFIRRVDGHAALANSTALKLAGITKETIIPGGHVEVLNGELTGIVLDNAIDSIRKIIPLPNKEQKWQAILSAQSNCFEVGLTTLDDAGLEKTDVELLEEMEKSGSLKMRVYVMLSDTEENLNYYLKKGTYATDRLNVRSFKFYGDGALGSYGACLLRPYSDSNTTAGFLLNNPSHFRTWAKRLKTAGFQMNTHCIGDSAARLILQIYGDVLEGGNDERWRIEHAQILDSADFSRFKTHAIIPSVQPTHATSDMRMAVLRLGQRRLKFGYAYRDLLKQNGIIALGTDFPVENISPLETFYAAVARKDKDGLPKNGFQIENALSREEALKGMTYWAAMANHEDTIKGTLEPGKLADFVVLDRDLLKCEEADILKTKVIATYIHGEAVYER